ncbi:hypothetical protein M406DRAFT_332162 [Cryphonectria parasitica EP155]|uniref:Rhodopsin domain-containing protein n=1 Tax=Cryphonectria parasitica (strain ATCC 38755 / EP155) TaxID=660469 RepID=A0A9P5CNA4_CRYP1|nr:uncharacterized protein M406DRAFT_332162 [Cryphonectria parasitica EP155]KAF3763700.1 hypothetical protein M406DRAFT_332162 [Cryphonectria parasitica EP155]
MASLALYDGAYAIAYTTFALGLLTTVLRYYAHLVITKSWGPDDSASVVVLRCSCNRVCFKCFLVEVVDCTLLFKARETFYRVLMVIFSEEIVVYTLHFVIKITFLLFFLRIWTSSGSRKFVFVGLAVNGSIFLSNILLTCLQCNSFQAIFDPASAPNAVCLDQLTVLIIPPVLNIAMDLYILALPVAVVWSLQISTRKKLQIIFVMSFGLCSVVVACVRLSVIPSLVSGPNETRQLEEIIIAAIEIQSAIIAMNLPSMKAIWARYYHKHGDSGATSGSESRLKSYELASTMKSSRSAYYVEASSRSQEKPDTVSRPVQGSTRSGSEERLFQGPDDSRLWPFISRDSEQPILEATLSNQPGVYVTRRFESSILQ